MNPLAMFGDGDEPELIQRALDQIHDLQRQTGTLSSAMLMIQAESRMYPAQRKRSMCLAAAIALAEARRASDVPFNADLAMCLAGMTYLEALPTR